jgi:hypothetical protein
LTLSWSIRCFAAPPGGWVNEGTVTTTHFEIHYERGSTSSHYATEEWINKVKQYLENAWSFQVPTWGRPPGVVDNSVRITVEVWDIYSNYGYGATSWGEPGDPADMWLDNDYTNHGFKVTGEEGLKITTAHEFFHCVQPNWIDYTTWLSSVFDTGARWFVEGTAEWMADKEYDNINGYIKDPFAEAFLNFPETSLDNKTGNAAYGCVLF